MYPEGQDAYCFLTSPALHERDVKEDTKLFLKRLFSFPNPVNEITARTVAGMVLAVSVLIVCTGEIWLLAFLTYGFLARVISGPTLSVMGQTAVRIVRILPFEERLVPGPPKRFAQGIGFVVSGTSLVLWLMMGSTVAKIGVALLILFSAMECILGICAGCIAFGMLMKIGVVPESVCEECRTFRVK